MDAGGLRRTQINMINADAKAPVCYCEHSQLKCHCYENGGRLPRCARNDTIKDCLRHPTLSLLRKLANLSLLWKLTYLSLRGALATRRSSPAMLR